VSGSYYQRDMITDNFETDFEQVSQDQQPGFAGRVDWRPAGGAR